MQRTNEENSPAATPASIACPGSHVGLVVSVVAGSAVALLVLLTGPILIGAFVSNLGMSEQSAGLLFSIEMFGLTLGSIAMFTMIAVSPRVIALISIALMVAGNFGAAYILFKIQAPVALLLAIRFVAGLGVGLMMTLTILIIGGMRNADSVYGMWTVGQLALGAAGLELRAFNLQHSFEL